jgi:cytidylate kinase
MREGKAGWFERRQVDQSRFAAYAAAQVFDLALEGDVLIRGWGATSLLRPVKHVPCIRVCAPLDIRVKWLMERLDTDDADFAREEIERSDSAHAARTRANFGVALDDPLLYDVVLNTGRLSVKSCVEQVIELTRLPEFKPTRASVAHLRNLALEARIHAALRASPESANIHITVEADGGAVTLRGTVFTVQEKKLAPKVVRGVAGVKSVSNYLRVITGAKLFPSDLE